ncbi:MAG TPA: CocE/NonD family hydrolase [Solirubrobacterales bacterium]|nr:CocE/NonD family hydrolase [Solirubrobacterales bacterium]
MGIERVRWVLSAAAAALILALAVAPSARAAFPTLYDGDVSCAAQPSDGNVRLCGGETVTWDGVTQIDVNVVLPPQPGVGVDGPYPVIGLFHGWGGKKIGLEDPRVQDWAEDGYVVFSMSDRGWGDSCGGQDPDRISEPLACAEGHNHLMDTRIEVRDAQHLIGALADEGVAEPKKIGATGVSYGGGLSMALAALRNRTMLEDDSLVPWTSPEKGLPMELAAAAPQWPWSDLAYSLMPNGRTLDYVADAPYRGPNGNAPIGVEKASYVAALYDLGAATSNYAPPGTDPDADLTAWYALINAGEPYDSNPLANSIVEEITGHHSSYYIDHSQPPAPLLIQSGWNDDLFPVDEAVRFYNRTRTEYPGDPISLFLMDDGHYRSQTKPADQALFLARLNAWFDHYLKGEGPAPQPSATALTTTCTGPAEGPSEGPYEAASWRELAPGEVRFGAAAAQTIVPGSGDPNIGKTFDPVVEKDACATASAADQVGTANYRLEVPGDGFTLIGSPTIVADIATANADSALAARLLDVSADDSTESLVARGLLRPGKVDGRLVFQLHPQGYRFAPGHEVKLELLPSDAPYARPSNQQLPITVSDLELRLPVREQPGSLGGAVKAPAPKILPPGYEPAAGYENEVVRQDGGMGGSNNAGSGAAGNGPGVGPAVRLGAAGLARGRMTVDRRGALRLRLDCAGGDLCKGRLSLAVGRRTLARGSYSIPSGTTRLKLRPTEAARAIVAAHRRRGDRSFRVRFALEDSGRSAPVKLRRRLHLERVGGGGPRAL